MKTAKLVFASFLVLFLGSEAFAQGKKAPNYTDTAKWEQVDEYKVSGELKGVKVELIAKDFTDGGTDLSNHVSVLHNEKGEPWLMLHVTVDRKSKTIVEAFFEKRGSDWVFVKDITNSDDLAEVLKSRYGLALS